MCCPDCSCKHAERFAELMFDFVHDLRVRYTGVRSATRAPGLLHPGLYNMLPVDRSCACNIGCLRCRNQGTGKGCIKASDGAAGPTCSAPKVGLCCDESETYGNCEPAAGQPCASYGGAGPTPLTPFCCDEMDLPGCYSAANPNGCVVSAHAADSSIYQYVSAVTCLAV